MVQHIEVFDNWDDMQASLKANAEAAAASLHPVQQALDLDSYWVQFDFQMGDPEVIFGHVCSAEYLDEQHAKSGDPDAEATRAEMNETHLMLGRAASRSFPRGELGYTHRASVWPISEGLFAAAEKVDWNPHALDDGNKALLEIAYQGYRTHKIAQAQQ